jgi:F-type H+-transporting ATPase subunit c
MKSKVFFLATALMFLAVPMSAQTSGGGSSPAQWKSVTAGFAMAIASGLCALGQGKAVAGAAEGMARNPAAAASIRFALILGLVLIESLGLYTMVIIFSV